MKLFVFASLVFLSLQAAYSKTIKLPSDYNFKTPSYLGYSSDFVFSKKVSSAPLGAVDLCQKYPWACLSNRDTRYLTERQLHDAARINRDINRSVKEISDLKQYGVEEYWTLPTKRGGDCEDFVLLKKLELQKLGVSPNRLLIATVLDRKNEAHAVLVFRTDWGDFILDNLTSKIMNWDQTKYSFLRIQDPQKPARWRAVLIGGLF